MTRGATPRTPTGSQLIIKQGRVTSQSVYQTIRHHEYNYSSNAPAPKRQKKIKNRLNTVKIYQRTEETAHGGTSGFSYCWVIAGFGGKKQLSVRTSVKAWSC